MTTTDVDVDGYETATEASDGWSMLLGDSVERLAELADNSVDLSVFSPPFAGLYSYSPSPRDLGNCENPEQFALHYRFIVDELLRVTRPGRNCCVHVADVATTKATHGVTGLYDLSGDVIRTHVEAGWTFYGRWLVDLDPQAVATRTKAQHLMFVTKNRDSARSAPATGDQMLLFRKPGANAVPIPHSADEPPPGVSNQNWIDWARPVWLDINRTRTLNVAVAKDDADTRHLHALQLDFIERCIRMWSNPGELVVTPFGGVGSESYVARRLGRRSWSCELKKSYFETAVQNMRRLDAELSTPTLFDDEVSS